jgi:hypothetical protein
MAKKYLLSVYGNQELHPENLVASQLITVTEVFGSEDVHFSYSKVVLPLIKDHTYIKTYIRNMFQQFFIFYNLLFNNDIFNTELYIFSDRLVEDCGTVHGMRIGRVN